MKLHVLPLWTTNPPGVAISTVSTSQSDLSPFLLGPCDLYSGYKSQNMENGWQYSKVYPEHVGRTDNIREEYFWWATEGWDNPRAVRYPMGKGRKPLFSLWKGKRLDYIDARKQIYVPLYARCVTQTDTYRKLKIRMKRKGNITLLDYDAYDHRSLGMTLTDVLNDPTRKMGHAFVLMMLLTNDPALEQCA